MSLWHLYTYGTLQVPRIMSRIIGREVRGRAARLRGYARFRVAERVYPAIVAAPGAELWGVVYEHLELGELQRLDVYEGALYERRGVRVETDGGELAACTYVLGQAHLHRLSTEPWDLERFEREHLESYLARISVTLRAP